MFFPLRTDYHIHNVVPYFFKVKCFFLLPQTVYHFRGC